MGCDSGHVEGGLAAVGVDRWRGEAGVTGSRRGAFEWQGRFAAAGHPGRGYCPALTDGPDEHSGPGDDLPVGDAIFASKGLGASLFDPGVLRAVSGGALYLTGVGLLGVGIGTILRRTAGAAAALVAPSSSSSPSSPDS